MATANLFQKLEYEAFRNGITPRTKESRRWFQRKAKEMTSVNRRKLMREDPLIIKPDFSPGSMFMFYYDPKLKKTLPYYDRFPLAIIVDSAPGGFYGLNMHYLPMTLRAKFLDSLLEVASSKRYDEKTKFEINYRNLKSASKFKYFKPCFKHYLNKHVKSNLAMVQAPEWEIATFLPVALWEKQSQSQIHRESRKMI